MENAIAKSTIELEQLENVIKQNIGAFYEVGRALMEIRDRGLYKDALGYDTFEAYCKDRWDFQRTYAYHLIASVKVVDTVSSLDDIQKPTNQLQTRPLEKLSSDQQRTAWQKAVETAPEGKVTAAHVSKVVREMTEPEKPKPYVLHKPIIEKEIVSEDFQRAYDNMIVELKNCRALKWKTTSYKAAMEMMKNLVTITEQMGR